MVSAFAGDVRAHSALTKREIVWFSHAAIEVQIILRQLKCH
jgi:hypothetical protein